MANTKPPAWEVTRLFLLPDGEFISRPVAVVHADDQDQAIKTVAETIKGIAILKARRLAKAKCPVCGQLVGARRCKPLKQAQHD